ncbi:uncharacterized protein LOC108670034 [Hyalella azteca]|uniref:Uncharacterized protein LOC108670034 n=1 Tax=Hyalella azteca TaxID=294128 RepID=A0A8B7NH65_HYAAZ|nr:uncharacterized protein LOC108670034 [Hyalella azteca]
MMYRTLLHLCFISLALAAIRVDQKRGFKFCDTPQLAQLVSVEVEGPGCSRWPCLLFPGRSGAFKITLYNQNEEAINDLNSDIHGTVRLNGVAGLTGRQKVGMPGEVKKKACQFTNPGCPIPPHSYFEITKVVTVPMQARMAHGMMMTEFKVNDGRGRTLTCFKAPVLLGK